MLPEQGSCADPTALQGPPAGPDVTRIEMSIELGPDYLDAKLVLDASRQRHGLRLTIEATRSGTKHVVILNEPLIEFLLDDGAAERLMRKKFRHPTLGKVRSFLERPGRPGLPALTLGTRPVRYRKLADGTRELAIYTGPGLIALPQDAADRLLDAVAGLLQRGEHA